MPLPKRSIKDDSNEPEDFKWSTSENKTSLEDSMKADNADHLSDTKNKEKDDRKTNIKIIIAAAAALVIIAGLFLMKPWDMLDNSKKDAPKKNTSSSTAFDKKNSETQPWYNKGDISPVDLPSWATKYSKPDATKITDQQAEDMNNPIKETQYKAQSETNLSSEAGGYTSDPSKAIDENGLPNPMFSYWTSEIFLKQSNDAVQRLINPYYGGWGQYQYSDSNAKANLDLSKFVGIFSQRYIDENFKKADKSFMPIYADWGGNNYGRNDLVPMGQTARWVGQVKGATSKWDYDRSALGYKATVVYNVEFTAFTVNQEKVTKNGTLTLTFVQSRKAIEDSKSYRVVIDFGSLVIN